MPLFGQDVLWHRDNYIINEAYIGKTPTLLEIESEFEALFRENHKMTEPLSTNEHIIKINRLFEKQFNMDTCALKIVPNDIVNGYTMVIGKRFDIAREVDLPSMVTGDATNGYRFKDDNGFILLVYIYYGLLINSGLTPGEIVGVILHEIGHNFADCLYGTINYANKDMMYRYEQYLIKYGITKGLLSALLHGVSVRDYIALKGLYDELNNENQKKEEKKFMAKSKAAHKLSGLVAGIKGGFEDWKSTISAVARKIKGGAALEKWMRMQGTAAKEKARKSVDRQNEVFADKFAGVYGYGPEVAAGLSKMTFKPTKADDIISKLWDGAQRAALEYDKAAMKTNDFDCHPQLVQRVMEEIKLLEREIKKDDIDPKVKDAIVEQINQLKSILEDLTDTTKKVSESEDAQRLYNDYVKNNCPDAVDDEIENAIEDALDKLIEESKKKNK